MRTKGYCNTGGTIFNSIRRTYVRPKQYEEQFCPTCKGTGEGELRIKSEPYLGVLVCEKCLGKGTVDWIKRLM